MGRIDSSLDEWRFIGPYNITAMLHPLHWYPNSPHLAQKPQLVLTAGGDVTVCGFQILQFKSRENSLSSANMTLKKLNRILHFRQ